MTSTKVQFEEMFPWEFAQAIARFPVCYIPLGVIEWHGEHNAVGLDALKAHAECILAAQKSGGVVFPPLYWSADTREDQPDGSYLTGGVEHGERYHVPGNMFWIQPQTYRQLMLDIYEAARRRGFKAILVVAGHWSTTVSLPILRETGREFIAQHPEMRWDMLTDQEAAACADYPHEHAAGAETSLLMAIRPDLVDLSKTLETESSLQSFYANMPQHLERRRVTPYKYIGVLRGVGDEMNDTSNDPDLTASPERGRRLLERVADRLAEHARVLLGVPPL